MPELIAGAFLLIQVGVAALVGRDAARRGREPLPWVLFTLVAPLFGVTIYVLTSRRGREAA